MLLFIHSPVQAQSEPGEIVSDFKLKNTEGQLISLSDFTDSKVLVLAFLSNVCPFSKAYEQRLILLHEGLAEYGYPVIAINPNDASYAPDESIKDMKAYAERKEFPFPFLKDDVGLYKRFGVSRTPEIVLLKNEGYNTFRFVYRGAFDSNPQDAQLALQKYVRQAINAIAGGNNPDPEITEAIGCTIKDK